jgi:hypothetical protein
MHKAIVNPQHQKKGKTACLANKNLLEKNRNQHLVLPKKKNSITFFRILYHSIVF